MKKYSVHDPMKCEACGELHRFYTLGMFSGLGVYEFACPTTKKRSRFRPNAAAESSAVEPEGAIRATRVDLKSP